MKWKFAAIAVAVGVAAQAGAQRLPPMPKLGHPLSAALDWCRSVGAEIEKEQQQGFIFLSCKIDQQRQYTFAGTEAGGYRIETAQMILTLPYDRPPSSWQGPYFCKPGAGLSECELYTAETDIVKSRVNIYFDHKRDQQAIWAFHHAYKRN